MTRIPEHDRDIIEQAMYLPMLLTVLDRDWKVFEQGNFKLNRPYMDLIENAMKAVQKDLKDTNLAMRKCRMRVEQVEHDDTFTRFMFFYKGYEELHSYFNPRIRNKVEELLRYYLYSKLRRGGV
ncbi:hypothetical protein [Bacillus sp. AK031]